MATWMMIEIPRVFLEANYISSRQCCTASVVFEKRGDAHDETKD